MYLLLSMGAGLLSGLALTRLAATELLIRDATPLKSWQELVSVCTTGLLFLAVTHRFLTPGNFLPWVSVTAAYWFLAAVCVLLAVIDFKTHLLPDRFVLPAIPISYGFLAVATVGANTGGGPLIRSILAGVVSYGLMYVLSLTNGLGLGDVKLSVILAAYTGWLGWPVVLSALVLSFIAGGLFALILVLLKRADRKTAVAFGPWLCVGTIGAILLSA